MRGNQQLHGRVAAHGTLERLLTGWERGIPSIAPAMTILGVLAGFASLAAAFCYFQWREGEMPPAAPITWGIFAALPGLAMLSLLWQSRRRR